MCYECVVDEGGPVPLTAAIRSAAAAVTALYELRPTGGLAHVVTDDFNLDDGDLEFARKASLSEKHHDGEDNSLELRVLDALQPLSNSERATALALAFRYVADVFEKAN